MPKKPPPAPEAPPSDAPLTKADPPKGGFGPDALLKGMPDSIRQWLLGTSQVTPPELANVVDQVAEKINMATAFLIVHRLNSLGRVMEFLSEQEGALLDPERVKKLSPEERLRLYQRFSIDSGVFMEFVRKFTLQNKELFNKKSAADELANMLRELDPQVVRELLRVVARKGPGTTVEDIKLDLAGVKPTKPKTLFEQLMGDEFKDD